MGWEALDQWGHDVARIERLQTGLGNEVWSVRVNGHVAVGRLGKRSDLDLSWETELMRYLHREGMSVPVPIPTTDGRNFADGLVVMTYVEGVLPETEADWRRVADTLRRRPHNAAGLDDDTHDVGRASMGRMGSRRLLGPQRSRRVRSQKTACRSSSGLSSSSESQSAPFTIGRVDEFVPRDFEVPRRLETPQFVLEPLCPEHNDQDYEAWSSSREHIHATPGWEDSRWPREMTKDENRADLQRHADDFRDRRGFTYTVLDPASRDVIGCVYIYPLPDSEYDARALSWVRASEAQLDTPLWRAVSEWLASEWPFGSVEYAPRG